jgi:hypothetical protein
MSLFQSSPYQGNLTAPAGSGGSGTGGASTEGAALFDVRKFGGVPGDSGGSVDSALDAIDVAMAKLPPTTWGAYYFPSDPVPWLLRDPRYVGRQYTTIRGAGRDLTTIKCSAFRHHTLFYLGMANAIQGAFSFDPAPHYQDLFGLVDATLAPKAGVMFAPRTRTDAIVSARGSLFNGPAGYFSPLGTFALNILLTNLTPNAAIPAGAICGITDGWDGGPMPYQARMSPAGTVEVAWRMSTESIPNTWFWRASWTLAPPTSATARIILQVNALTGVASCWYDTGNGAAQVLKQGNPRITRTDDNGFSGSTFTPGGRFADQYGENPFNMGANVPFGNTQGLPANTPADRTFAGLALLGQTRAAQFAGTGPTPYDETTAAGSHLKDGRGFTGTQKDNDLARPTYLFQNSICHLDPDTAKYGGPSARGFGRTVWFAIGPLNGNVTVGGAFDGCFVVHGQQFNQNASVSNMGIAGMTLVGNGVGTNLQWGGGVNYTLRDLRSGGSYVGISNWSSGSGYPHILDGLEVGATMMGLYAEYMETSTFRHVHATARCPITFNGVNADFGPQCFCATVGEDCPAFFRYLGWAQYGGQVYGRGFTMDNEQVGVGPKRAYFHIQNPSLVMGAFRFDNSIVQMVSPECALVEFEDRGSGRKRCEIRVEPGVVLATAWPAMGGLLKISGTNPSRAANFAGRIDPAAAGRAMVNGFDAACAPGASYGGEVVLRGLDSIPSGGQWGGGYPGNLVSIENLPQIPGTPSRARSCGTGTSATRPTGRSRFRYALGDVYAPIGNEGAVPPMPQDYVFATTGLPQWGTIRPGEGRAGAGSRLFFLGTILNADPFPSVNGLVVAPGRDYMVGEPRVDIPGWHSPLPAGTFALMTGNARSTTNALPIVATIPPVNNNTDYPRRSLWIGDNAATPNVLFQWTHDWPIRINPTLTEYVPTITLPAGSLAVGDAFNFNADGSLSGPGRGYIDESSAGWATRVIQAFWNSILAAGPTMTPLAGLYAGVSTLPPYAVLAAAAGALGEPTGGGYGRVPVGFTSGSASPFARMGPVGGQNYHYANTLDYAIPVPAGGPYYTLFLSDTATGGTAVHAAMFYAPITLAAGGSIKIAATAHQLTL